MNTEHLLSIGGFAMLSGLSVTALRHYDEVGVLLPTWVDPATGYRRYRPEQVREARLIRVLRRLEMPVESIRQVVQDPSGPPAVALLGEHRSYLARRAEALAELAREAERYVKEGVGMPALKGSRIVQVTVNATDRDALVAFYRSAFAATFNEEIGSFEFGTWPSQEFFLLTIADDRHPGPTGPARFGLLVEDVDSAHQLALDAGAAEIYPPVERPWKPRSSCVADPSGNHIDLYQG
ncbi:MerR family transcriptional regulator [Micromonospora mirobrigensis]|uniref:DNA-binding transcriptional regulator, MerR family n=1 Tax=Micromonospora mirobrigensis TaxID=262898 RepID=A0A1C4UNH0_9ACTN|nr:MerR family transcriptional regulator [Micromonospora mirobrigensis]SCE73194.1 DNA-binding transcriptional regulator, MerR family [Micromonospora mirobrigensis]